tara:strand:- start:429 stop:2165 length:1737 start_codon:yes stop_codon:yes gene_type:complete
MAAVAIPIIILGSLYILSEQEKKNKFENYSNYDSKNIKNLDDHLINNDINKFDNSVQNTGVDNNNNNQDDNTQQPSINLMSGENVDQSKFKHNNMQAFYGAKIRGPNIDSNINESILDSKQGYGSQFNEKKELEPLFKPNDNMTNIYGASNNNDFYQSRVNESMKMSNYSLTEPQRVAPGLGLGYGIQTPDGVNNGGTEGMGGFNSGMLSRESWMPKTVDELRVDSNKKESYQLNGFGGPAQSSIQNINTVESLGKIEKHLPEKFFENTSSRWLTTTGSEKAQTTRSDIIMRDSNRIDTTQDYYGNAISNNTQYNEIQNYQDSTRQQLPKLPVGIATAVEQNNQTTTSNKDSYNLYNNNRNTTSNTDFTRNVVGLIKESVSPFLDVFKETRKQHNVHNNRMGNISNTVNYKENNNVLKPKITNREMSTGKLANNHMNVQNQVVGNNVGNRQNYQPVENQRDTTNKYYVGTGNNNSIGNRNHSFAYTSDSGFDKTFSTAVNHGSKSVFNNNTNIKMSKDQTLLNNNRDMIMNGGPNVVPNAEFIGQVQGVNEYKNNDRNDQNLLAAFKNNPYTQSLQSL